MLIRHHHNSNLNCINDIFKSFQAGSVTAIKGGIILLLLLLLPSPLSHRSGVAVKIQTRPRQLSSLSRHEKWPQLTLSRQRLPKAQKSTKKTSSALRLPRMSTLTFEWKQNRPEQLLFHLSAFKSERQRDPRLNLNDQKQTLMELGNYHLNPSTLSFEDDDI